MEEYIGTVIKVGGIVIGSVMVLFVIWYIVKDILDISGKDSSDGKYPPRNPLRYMTFCSTKINEYLKRDLIISRC